MRQLFIFNLVSLDGYFEGQNRDLDWHNVDSEFNEYAIDMLNSVDTLIFGRVTYELMARYWPTPAAKRDDPIIAERMNGLPKIVFSRTMNKADWQNTRVVKDNMEEEIPSLKQQPGKDLAIFGSSDLAVTLMGRGLIDEYRIMVNPVVLGSGKPLFRGLNDRLKLKLLRARTFQSGNVLLYYRPDRKR